MKNKFSDKGHPLHLIKKIIKENRIEYFFVSTYKYVPNSIVDVRNTFKILADQDIDQQITNVPMSKDEELAIHSVVYSKKNNDLLHIPMVDFFSSSIEEISFAIKKIQTIFPFDTYIYDSGRSYHAYMNCVINSKQWYEYIGYLLLLNETHKPNVVDVRWLGHRLIAGYFSLRLSCNSSNYIKTPDFKLALLID